MRILIIEDDEPYANLLESYLINHQVDRVLTLEDGLLKINDENIRYDIILLDLGFPRSTPSQTLNRVFSRSPHSAVVVVTGNTGQHLMEQAFDLGIHGYIIKNEVTTTNLNVMIVSAYNVHKRLQQYKTRLEELAVYTTQVWQSSTVDLYKTADAVSKSLVELHDKIKGWPK